MSEEWPTVIKTLLTIRLFVFTLPYSAASNAAARNRLTQKCAPEALAPTASDKLALVHNPPLIPRCFNRLFFEACHARIAL
jgi:hypothetical protein